MKQRKSKSIVIFLIISFVFILELKAEEVDGKKFKDHLTIENTTLKIKGTGLLRYWGFKAYVGALYTEVGYDIENGMTDKAKRIELEYFRPIKGEDFGPATDKSISKNVDAETFERLRPQIDYHNSLYENVEPGDRYSLTYIPGRGTELALNGEPKGIIEGADFAEAVFSIWLGPKPLNKSFKEQIMGI